MHSSPFKLTFTLIAVLLSATSLMAAEKPPRPVSVTHITPSNAAEINAGNRAEMLFKQAVQKADAAMKRVRDEGGKWQSVANLLMQSSMTSRSGDFQTAIKMANQAEFMAEESYDAVITARKAEAEMRAAAAAKKAAEEKAAAAKLAATRKENAAQAAAKK